MWDGVTVMQDKDPLGLNDGRCPYVTECHNSHYVNYDVLPVNTPAKTLPSTAFLLVENQ